LGTVEANHRGNGLGSNHEAFLGADAIGPVMQAGETGGGVPALRRRIRSDEASRPGRPPGGRQLLSDAGVVVKSIGSDVQEENAKEDRDGRNALPNKPSSAAAGSVQGRFPACAIVRQALKL